MFSAFETAPCHCFTATDIATILRDNHAGWELPQTFGPGQLISFLTDVGRLREVVLKSDFGDIRRFVWGDASPYSIALSLRPGAYLSHASAMFLHGLADEEPRVIYVNKEQSPKPPPRGGLTQQALDRAFQNSQRASKYVYDFDSYQAVILNGKHSDRLEVGQEPAPKNTGELIDVTKIERTLIDIAVRPAYAGGVKQVLAAFQHAKERMSVETLIATLKRLEYVYPYHQAIGFYMERAGYEPAKLALLKQFGLKHDFYLAHGLKDLIYDATWRLHRPKDL
ncbi:MAG TPA: hypothetical protein VEU33_04650 [Archangium sp.]|nr:hypothetical protein [Archangium sp.]